MARANQPSPSQLLAAADAIFRAWLPLIGEIEAREQAQAFASRFHVVPRRVPVTASGNSTNGAVRSL